MKVDRGFESRPLRCLFLICRKSLLTSILHSLVPIGTVNCAKNCANHPPDVVLSTALASSETLLAGNTVPPADSMKFILLMRR